MSYQKEICKRAVEQYGKQPQIIMAMEEMSELIQSLSKSIRGKENVDNIAEEIADVEIMLMQLKMIFHCETRVNSIKSDKTYRLEERLNKKQQERSFWFDY